MGKGGLLKMRGEVAIGCLRRQYLGLDAVEAAEPEDLAAAQLTLSVVDLLHFLHSVQLLVGNLTLLRAVARRLKELQPAHGN